jgi:hypothetical protein
VLVLSIPIATTFGWIGMSQRHMSAHVDTPASTTLEGLQIDPRLIVPLPDSLALDLTLQFFSQKWRIQVWYCRTWTMRRT